MAERHGAVDLPPSVNLIGAVELAVAGQPQRIDRLQVRQVLAILAANQPRAVEGDHLIDELWPSELPVNPRRSMQLAVSRLRAVLGDRADVLRTVGSGYALDGIITDIARFRDLHDQAERCPSPDRIAILVEDALKLWHGPPFMDAAGPPFLDRVRMELEERRDAVRTLQLEALVAKGDAKQAIALGIPLFEADLLRERVAVALARALSMEGRRSEALTIIGRLREALRSAEGIDPSQQVADLELDILTGTTELRSAAARPDGRDALFVGRQSELGQLTDLIRRRTPALVVGEAGIGKSQLLEAALRAVDGVGPVVAARVAAEPARPLEPIADLVQGLVHLGAEVCGSGQEAALARLLPDWPAPEAGTVGRDELVVELARFVRQGAERVSAVLLLEDLHHLDPLSARTLEEIIGTGRAPLVATSRPSSLPHVTRMLDGRTPAQVVPLGPLRSGEIEQYLELRRPPQWSKTQSDLVGRSGGNPLFLRLLVDLELEGALDPDRLPASILIAVKQRLDQLSPRAAETLKVAAAIGARFSLPVLREACSSAELDLVEALEAGLVTGPDDGVVAFLHGLVAEASYQLLPVGRRVEVHDRLGRIVQGAGRPATEYVGHFRLSASLDPIRAAQAHLDAGLLCSTTDSLEQAVRYFVEGLKILDSEQMGHLVPAIELAIRLGRAQRLLADPSHVSTLINAARRSRGVGEYDLFALAVIELCRPGGTIKVGGRDSTVMALVQEALSLPLSDTVRIELLASVSAVTARSSRYRDGQQCFWEAWGLASASGDPDLEAQVLAHLHLGLSHPDDARARSAATERLRQVTGSDADLRAEVAFLRFWEGLIDADRWLMEISLREMRTLAPRVRHRRLGLLHLEAAYAHALGNLELAERYLEEAGALFADLFPGTWTLAHHADVLLAIRDSQGRLGELTKLVDDLLEVMPETPSLRAAAALVAVESGRMDRARSELDALSVDGFAALARDLTWTATLCAAGRVAVAVADREAAQSVYQLLVPFRGRMSWDGNCTHGPNDRVLGDIARLLGEPTVAVEHWSSEARLVDRLRGPFPAGFVDGAWTAMGRGPGHDGGQGGGDDGQGAPHRRLGGRAE